MSKTSNFLWALRVAAAAAVSSGCGPSGSSEQESTMCVTIDSATKTTITTTNQNEITFSNKKVRVIEWMRVGADKGSCGTPRNVYAVEWVGEKNFRGKDSISLLQVGVDFEDKKRLIAGREYVISGTSVVDNAAGGRITTFNKTPKLLPELTINQETSTNSLKDTTVLAKK